MNQEKQIRQIEKQLGKPLTELMRIIQTHYCDVATPNDIFEIREGKYQLIRTIYTIGFQNDTSNCQECSTDKQNIYK